MDASKLDSLLTPTLEEKVQAIRSRLPGVRDRMDQLRSAVRVAYLIGDPDLAELHRAAEAVATEFRTAAGALNEAELELLRRRRAGR